MVTTAGGYRLALAQLAEQDPLINVRLDDTSDEISVSLYGEVQKQVIEATLADDFGVDVEFRDTTPLYVERPVRTGEAVEVLHAESNPYLATIGLRVDPAPFDSGVDFRLEVDARSAPLYVYKTLAGFTEHMTQYVRHALEEGLSGWQVTDCVVTMTKCVYSVPDGPPSRRGPLEHGGGLSQADADCPRAGARGGDDRRLRADRSRPSRDPVHHGGNGDAGRGAARRCRRVFVAPGRALDRGDGLAGDAGSGAPAAVAEADRGRGRPRVRLRRLPAGDRRPADPAVA